MLRKILSTIALGSFALVVMLGVAGQGRAHDAKAPISEHGPA